MIQKILIANRGEIAIRVMRTASDMGIKTVAVFSDADKDALFVKHADEAVCLGGNYAADNYLNQDKIIAAARKANADAIHPGYGFLSENASFAKRCKEEGIVFIGPSYEAIEKLGSKVGAKELMQKAAVPTVPGYNGADQQYETFKKEALKIGYPVLLKASAGGGGKGMRIVEDESQLHAAFETAASEAEKSFGSGTLLMEKYFPKAKHIEFQIFGDTHGNYVHLFERECSLQRRYQKVIEESPSPSLNEVLRKEMGEAAVAVAKAVNYTNAGTVEFILDDKNNFYFLEVNTRLQVEHPVTEETTGLDLVCLQIEVASGLPLSFRQEDLVQNGHAIEARICAEDAANNFLPATGDILFWSEPALKGLRYDSGVATGSKVGTFYDSMIAKVIAKGENRSEAIQKLHTALDKMSVLGITTNKDFLKELLQHPQFVDGSFDTKLIERDFSDYKRNPSEQAIYDIVIAATLFAWQQRKEQDKVATSLNGWRNNFYQKQVSKFLLGDQRIEAAYVFKKENKFNITIDAIDYLAEIFSSSPNQIVIQIDHHLQSFFIAKKQEDIFIQHPAAGTYQLKEIPRFQLPGSELSKGDYVAAMPGEVVKILVKPGDQVKAGKPLLVMSSMKMETTIEAHSDGEVEEVFVVEKSFVEANAVLIKMKD